MHFANSTDGVVWSKPPLGLVNLSRFPGLNGVGTRNNVVAGGDGTSVYYDPTGEPHFKSFGTICLPNEQGKIGSCIAGTAVSEDGFRFHDP